MVVPSRILPPADPNGGPRPARGPPRGLRRDGRPPHCRWQAVAVHRTQFGRAWWMTVCQRMAPGSSPAASRSRRTPCSMATTSTSPFEPGRAVTLSLPHPPPLDVLHEVHIGHRFRFGKEADDGLAESRSRGVEDRIEAGVPLHIRSPFDRAYMTPRPSNHLPRLQLHPVPDTAATRVPSRISVRSNPPDS